MYRLQVKPEVQKVVEKLAKKDKKQVEIIFSKVNEILQDPHRSKNLRSPLNHWKRVHIDSHFVLIFSVDERKKLLFWNITAIMTKSINDNLSNSDILTFVHHTTTKNNSNYSVYSY